MYNLMQRKIIHIYFIQPASQESLNSFKESLYDFDLEFFGQVSSKDISGEVKSNGMFNLIKAPLLKVLEQAGLVNNIKNLVIENS